MKTSALERPPCLGDRLSISQGAFDREVYVMFNGKRTAGFDGTSTLRVKEHIASVSLLLSGTAIQDGGTVRVLVARPTTMGKPRGEKSVLDGLI